MISDEKQRTQWGCRSCVIVREVWRRGEGWGWEVVGFITYYLKKNYLYYYFIILFLEFANCFQLFISSIPIYVVHIYAT